MTVDCGTTIVLGDDIGRLEALGGDVLSRRGKRRTVPPVWDGRAAGRIADCPVGKQ